MSLLGAITASRRRDTTPSFGYASRLFDGSDDYIDLGDTGIRTALNSSAYTVCAWARSSDVSKLAGITSGNSFNGYEHHLRLYLAIVNPQHYQTTWYGSYVANNVWFHAALTFSTSAGAALTVNNGTPVTQPAATTQQDCAAPIGIGYDYRPGAGRLWVGNIADVRFYNRALSGSEIADIYAGAHVADGLIGWYLVDSDDVTDWSGSGNSATNYGSTFSTDGPFD